MDDTPAPGAFAVIASALGLDTGPTDHPAPATATPPVWRGPFDVDGLAVSCVAAATDAAAELLRVRNPGRAGRVSVDPRHAAACFLSEALVEPVGWSIPPVWDPVAGDYLARDGWIRLHTNYPHHRAAALEVLGVPDEPDADASTVAARVAEWDGDELEAAVVAAGGVAGRQRVESEWRQHPGSSGWTSDPILERTDTVGTTVYEPGPALRPFDDIRVVDLTRVLAGPTATGFLAAWGADVLRIDPPGFPEVAAVQPITTAGKRCASLDLSTPTGRGHLLRLLDDADVVVHGYRPEALAGLGLDSAVLHDRRPGLVEVTLDAYGWSGPWADRRGFDSIVQHSVGITAAGQSAIGAERPVPLPCQALDHGAGWIMAASVASALAHRCRTGSGSVTRTSLAAVAALLMSLPRDRDPRRTSPTIGDLEDVATIAPTTWGPLRRLRWPGRIDDVEPLMGGAGPIGSAPASW